MDFEVALKIQKCAMGEEMEFTRGEIAGEAIDVNKLVKGMDDEKKAAAMAVINSFLNDSTSKVYDGEAVMDEMESIRSEIEKALKSDERLPLYLKMQGAVDGLFMSPPFTGIDDIAAGIIEVCVFACLEHYAWKKTGFDHEYYRNEFRYGLAKRANDKIADYWMGVYDELQAELTDDLKESYRKVFAMIEKQEPGKSQMTEADYDTNIVKLSDFMEAQLRGIK